MIKILDLPEKDKNGNPTISPLKESEEILESGLRNLIKQVEEQTAKKIYQDIYKQMEVWISLANIDAGGTLERAVDRGRANALALFLKDEYLTEEQKNIKNVVASTEYKN